MSTPDEKMVQKPSNRAGIWVAVAVVLIVVILVVVGFSAGWFGSKSTPANTTPPPPGVCVPPSSQSLVGAGSTFVFPLMFTWETSYTASSINYESVGSGAGITQLAAKTVDYGASDAPLSPAQQATASGVITIPETAGAVSIIYNLPGIDVPLKFNGTALAEIYMGTLTNWNNSVLQALNPGVILPNLSIIVVFRSDGSGTSFAYSEYLSKESSSWASAVGFSTTPKFPVGTGEKGSAGVSGYVRGTTGTIGYVDLEYALSNGISFGEVQNPAGQYILPTLNSTAAAVKDGAGSLPAGNNTPAWYNVSLLNEPGAADYPISTFSYLLIYQSLDGAYGSSYSLQKAEGLLNFVNWTITTGQSYSGQLYYVPLPANVVAADQASLKLFTYSGAAVPLCA
jgi:phosphate transport system substrate-binding protein